MKYLKGCETGDAKITHGYNLGADYVIHTVGPVWNGGGGVEDNQLASCYRRSLELAAKHDIDTIAFPAISTGVYRFPIIQAAEIAVRTVGDYLNGNEMPAEVIFCCFGPDSVAAHEAAMSA